MLLFFAEITTRKIYEKSTMIKKFSYPFLRSTETVFSTPSSINSEIPFSHNYIPEPLSTVFTHPVTSKSFVPTTFTSPTSVTITKDQNRHGIEIEILPTPTSPSFFLSPNPTYPQALKPFSLDPRQLEDLTDEGVPLVHVVLYGCGGGFAALLAIGGTVYWVLLRRQRSGTVSLRRSRTVSDPRVRFNILFFNHSILS
jgi:hypothetical protein